MPNTTIDARTLVTATAETFATASRAHWSYSTREISITRRRLPSGAVRIRITVQDLNTSPALTQYRDLPTAEADTEFARVLRMYDDYYRTLAHYPHDDTHTTWATARAA